MLAVDAWQHWVLCIGRCVDRYIIIDSSNTVANKAENGIHVISRKELVRRWFHKEKKTLDAVALLKK